MSKPSSPLPPFETERHPFSRLHAAGPSRLGKAERIVRLAQEVADSYDLFSARRIGAGNDYTHEVVDHLKSRVVEEFGSGVVNQFLAKGHGQSVDFWLEEEQTIVEVEFSMLTLLPVLEKEVFKALLAQDEGKDVRHLVLIGDPGAVRQYRTPTARSVMQWVEREHGIRVQVRELKEIEMA